MPHQDHRLARLADLRQRAAFRLSGRDPGQNPAARAADALTLLHALASSPDTAADALALLHELQVHQVELDLQAEELRESRAELEAALRRQIELYDFQPVACFTVDRHLVIRELNLTGATLLGVDRDEACGLTLDTFLSADSTRDLLRQVEQVMSGGARAASTLRWKPRAGTSGVLRVDIGADPTGGQCLLAVTRADDMGEPPP